MINDSDRKATMYFLSKLYGKEIFTPEVMTLIEDGLITISSLHENYEAFQDNTEVVGGKGQDLKNGKECKFRTLIFNTRNGYSNWAVLLSPRDTKVKTGDIVLAIHNVVTNTLDRLHIPKAKTSSHGYVSGKGVYINFSSKGKGYGKYQKYLISSEQL